ncbi:hypothetical protein [Aneurinibacillus tyrosinisolvens]|uniref:hypothetical protein n=1 Tax=Aneurinibacillus tyrosinisolvens TaxID=1443435 RepID=UPI00063F4DCF|nr:hypothetical protein [Aneurinibacillus tyrosinisolvens]
MKIGTTVVVAAMLSVTAGFYFYSENKTVENQKAEARVVQPSESAQVGQTEPKQMDKVKVEMVKVGFDNRSWKEGFRDINEQSQMIEYVLSNETVHNWSELVTVQYFPGARNPQQLFDVTKDKVKQLGIQSEFKLVNQTEKELVYGWYVEDQPKKGIPAQVEISRIIQVDEGTYWLHYAIKSKDPSKKGIDDWTNRLSAVKISE